MISLYLYVLWLIHQPGFFPALTRAYTLNILAPLKTVFELLTGVTLFSSCFRTTKGNPKSVCLRQFEEAEQIGLWLVGDFGLNAGSAPGQR